MQQNYHIFIAIAGNQNPARIPQLLPHTLLEENTKSDPYISTYGAIETTKRPYIVSDTRYHYSDVHDQLANYLINGVTSENPKIKNLDHDPDVWIDHATIRSLAHSIHQINTFDNKMKLAEQLLPTRNDHYGQSYFKFNNDVKDALLDFDQRCQEINSQLIGTGFHARIFHDTINH